MNKILYKIAVESLRRVYKINFDLGAVEFDIHDKLYGQRWIQVLAIAGTNEARDWLWNFNLFSWAGIKIAGYLAAKKIRQSEEYRRIRNPNVPLLIACHSKSGPTGVAFKRLYGCDWLVMFAPAPSLRRWVNRVMVNTVIFIDPDDIVHQAGIINFGHPICPRVTAPNDHFGKYLGDHKISHWVKFVNKMPSMRDGIASGDYKI